MIIAISRIQVTDIEPNDFWINLYIKYDILYTFYFIIICYNLLQPFDYSHQGMYSTNRPGHLVFWWPLIEIQNPVRVSYLKSFLRCICCISYARLGSVQLIFTHYHKHFLQQCISLFKTNRHIIYFTVAIKIWFVCLSFILFWKI